MSETRSPWTISYGIGGARHFVDLKIFQNRTAVVTRTVSGETRAEVEAAVSSFLKSEDAKRLESIYAGAL